MKKAIQTWVAIVLAIIIAIAIAVPIYLWVATLTAPKETKVGKGNMAIEDISWSMYDNATGAGNGSSANDTIGKFYYVRIVIKNTGSIPLVITDIYVKQGAITLIHFYAADTDDDGDLNWAYTGGGTFESLHALLTVGEIDSPTRVLYGYCDAADGTADFIGYDVDPNLITVPVGSSIVMVIVFRVDNFQHWDTDNSEWVTVTGDDSGYIGANWSSGYPYTFKVVSSSGAIAEETQVAP